MSSLQTTALFSANAFRHEGLADCPLLSVKCMFNGTARYRADRSWFAVDETGYLILNDRQPYEIYIASPTRVESFIIYFPRGWVQDVARTLDSKPGALLETPAHDTTDPVHFFERFTPHDQFVSPLLSELRRAHKSGSVSELWLEQTLRQLLARMLESQEMARRTSASLAAMRASTREELWRRLNRARDFIHAEFESSLSLEQIAAAACLSPFHFLRAFKALFQTTPHEYLSACRIERAKFLLERTALPVTEICFEVGFESLGSFSSWFRRLAGNSPRAWRNTAKKAIFKKSSTGPFAYDTANECDQF